MFGTQWLGSLAEDHCCCSSTGWNKAEHEAGGQGKPVMLAAGFAICSLPPLLWFQTTQQSLHQPWGVLCMGAVLCREDELLCWCCLQSTSTPSILQMHSLVKIICIISSVRWITPVETGQFFFFFFYLILSSFTALTQNCQDKYGVCLASVRFLWTSTILCGQKLQLQFETPTAIWKIWKKLFGILRCPVVLMNARLCATISHTTDMPLFLSQKFCSGIGKYLSLQG